MSTNADVMLQINNPMRVDAQGAQTQSSANNQVNRAERLTPVFIRKPWGRRDGIRAPEEAQPLGEIIYDAAAIGLVIKWLQTSEPLSIQVHPQRGARKHEWWYVAEAEAGSYLYLGLKQPAASDEIARRAEDGSLPELLRRIEPAAGDMFYVEAGTIHALGPGLTVVEVQEPSDVTWRLFDYGRPRELHIGEAMREAIRDVLPVCSLPGEVAPFRVAVETLAPRQLLKLDNRAACIAIVEGSGALGDQSYQQHECWRINGTLSVEASDPTILIIAEPQNAEPAAPRRTNQ